MSGKIGTPFELATRYREAGINEIPVKGMDHPLIQWWLSLCGLGINAEDEVPWCSAFMNGVFWELRMPRSYSAAARSWLLVGKVITISMAVAGSDVVILKRGAGVQPGPEVLHAPGHVGLFAGLSDDGYTVSLLAGNQGNTISVMPFSVERVIGVRRIS